MKKNSSVTINDVASEAGVSKSTVSLVIRNSSLVKPATRKVVVEAMQRIGYVYNRDAANFRSRSSNIVGLIIHDLTNPFFAEMYVGLEKRLANSGYIALLSNTSEDAEVQLRNFNIMKEHRIAGFIVCPAQGTDQQFIEALKQQNTPVVSVIRRLPDPDKSFDYISADVRQGTYLATRHLLEQGYRHVGYIGGLDTPIRKDRLKGYKQALSEFDLRVDEKCIYTCQPTRANGEKAIRELMLSPNVELDACVCYNDLVALGTLWGLHDLGVAVGKEFGVVGFDNVAAAAHTTPPLTSVASNSDDIGRAAAERLLHRIENNTEQPVHIVKPVELVVRNSSGRQPD